MGYDYDKTGRPIGVTGAGYSGVTSYVNSISYRAFAAKQVAYGNGRTLSLQYDNRTRMRRWDIPGVMGWEYFYNYFGENSGRVTYAKNLYDGTLDRSYDYDHVGRMTVAYSGEDARAHVGIPGAQWGIQDGPYASPNWYDVWGNITDRQGWGGENPWFSASYANNKRNGFTYDLAGNLRNDLGQNFTYDATGQQAQAAFSGYLLQQSYDGNLLRVKKVENGTTTYYLRSSVLGGQVVAEIDQWGGWQRGYVYLGGQLLEVQQSGVNWVHQDPIAKSKRVTNAAGNIVSIVELDPWGGNTNKSSNVGFQPRRFTSYERDVNGSDEAMHRRYNRWHSRFDQPDPYDGSYSLADPQSFNRYAYTQNDPVNFVDPSGLLLEDPAGMSRPRDGGNPYGFFGNTIGALHHAMDRLVNVHFSAPETTWDPVLGYWVGHIASVPQASILSIAIFGGPRMTGGGPFDFLPETGGSTGGSNPQPPRQPPPQEPRCVTSPYVNFGASVGNLLLGGGLSLLASGRGIYLQLGGGVALSPRLGVAPPRIQRWGPNFTVRASKSGITDGWGETLDFGLYARNYDASGRLVSQEGGTVGLPTASRQATYTFRIYNPNNCK